jgi:hypothetical protein
MRYLKHTAFNMSDPNSQAIKEKLNKLTKDELLAFLQQWQDSQETTKAISDKLDLDHKENLVDICEYQILIHQNLMTDVAKLWDQRQQQPSKKANSVSLSLWLSLKKLLLSEGKYDRLFVLTYGGLSIGTALGQLPGAIIGGVLGITYGLYLTFRHRSARDVHSTEDERTYSE